MDIRFISDTDGMVFLWREAVHHTVYTLPFPNFEELARAVRELINAFP
jgi:hypothetical protein